MYRVGSLPAVTVSLRFTGFQLHINRLVARFQNLQDNNHLTRDTMFHNNLSTTSLKRVRSLRALIPDRKDNVATTPHNLSPLNNVHTKGVDNFKLTRRIVGGMMTVRVRIPAVNVTMNRFRNASVTSFVHPTRGILSTPVTPKLTPGLLHRLSSVLREVNTLVPSHRHTRRRTPVVFTAILRGHLRVLRAAKLGLIVASQTSPGKATKLRTKRAKTVHFVMRGTLTNILTRFPATFAETDTTRGAACHTPLYPTIATRLHMDHRVKDTHSQVMKDNHVAYGTVGNNFTTILFLRLHSVTSCPRTHPRFKHRFLQYSEVYN